MTLQSKLIEITEYALAQKKSNELHSDWWQFYVSYFEEILKTYSENKEISFEHRDWLNSVAKRINFEGLNDRGLDERLTKLLESV